MIIVFYDSNSDVVNLYKEVFKYKKYQNCKIFCINQDMFELVKKYKIDAFVSTTNSNTVYYTGYGDVFKKAFKGAGTKVLKRAKIMGVRLDDEYILPVGSAVLIDTKDTFGSLTGYADLIVSPVNVSRDKMLSPDNVYHSFMGILRLCNKEYVIAYPCFIPGMKYYNMNECIEKIAEALDDHQYINRLPSNKQNILYQDEENFIVKRSPPSQSSNIMEF